jgi:hypothetical protein
MGYNKFRWYTNTKARPLSVDAPLLLRIRNGDFERSRYFAEAEQARTDAKVMYELTKKNSLIADPHQLEREALDSARMKRVKALKLMEVGHDDEMKRLNELRKALRKEFDLELENDLWDKSMERQRGKGTTEDLYWWYKKQLKLAMTPSEVDIKLKRKNTNGLEYLFV